MLYRKGIFTRLDKESMGVNAHNYEYVTMWRKVLDEMLISLISADVSAAEHSMKWFNCQPGDVDYWYDEITKEENQVDMYDEFCEVCSLASLDPVLVTKVANEVFERAKDELDRGSNEG